MPSGCNLAMNTISWVAWDFLVGIFITASGIDTNCDGIFSPVNIKKNRYTFKFKSIKYTCKNKNKNKIFNKNLTNIKKYIFKR